MGGFNQPFVTCALFEQPGNVEKGLTQRFLWLFPKPVYAPFDNLESISDTFVDLLGKLQIIITSY